MLSPLFIVMVIKHNTCCVVTINSLAPAFFCDVTIRRRRRRLMWWIGRWEVLASGGEVQVDFCDDTIN